MKNTKFVAIYIDQNENILSIPSGRSKDGYIKNINLVNELKYPYSDDELESLLIKSLEQCFTLETEDDEVTVLEKYLGIKGEQKANKGRRLVALWYLEDSGFEVCPSKKNRGGFAFQKGLVLGETIEKGELAIAFKKMLELSN